ncbi:hypothetical protein SFA35_15610 [Pseudomonas sp. HR96]|uniref:hypothetical protein n=1 Tax=Pseudomonas sp. HR96 TaxID=1027966 RepID=UPI002A762D03|nr:hypothetical protein [Pseudomonas sp. HR96]WPO98076.1 hypothetical protein SFA35_15610 [Pseudomonas sp. HR96]
MKTSLIYLLPILAMAGCASAPNSPSVTLTTSKSPGEYAQCILPKWQAERPGTQMTQHRELYTLTAPSGIAADQILEVHKTSTGSQVALYLRGAVLRTRLEKHARSCL